MGADYESNSVGVKNEFLISSIDPEASAIKRLTTTYRLELIAASWKPPRSKDEQKAVLGSNYKGGSRWKHFHLGNK